MPPGRQRSQVLHSRYSACVKSVIALLTLVLLLLALPAIAADEDVPKDLKDADYITDGNQTVAIYNEKWSYRPGMNVAEMRYCVVATIRLRPGHDKEWEDLVALYKAAAEKIKLDEHDIFFEARYGAPAGTVYIFTPLKSLADLDAAMGARKVFQEALGPDGQKKWAELIEATIANDSSTLVRFSPEMSYPPDAWVKADPDYWKPKAMAAPKAPAAAAPKAAPATKN